MLERSGRQDQGLGWEGQLLSMVQQRSKGSFSGDGYRRRADES